MWHSLCFVGHWYFCYACVCVPRGLSISNRNAESISQSQRHSKAKTKSNKRKLSPKIGCSEIVFLHFKYVIKAGLRHYKHHFKAAKMFVHSCCHAQLFSLTLSGPVCSLFRFHCRSHWPTTIFLVTMKKSLHIIKRLNNMQKMRTKCFFFLYAL